LAPGPLRGQRENGDDKQPPAFPGVPLEQRERLPYPGWRGQDGARRILVGERFHHGDATGVADVWGGPAVNTGIEGQNGRAVRPKT
jgi:hypothetical protein